MGVMNCSRRDCENVMCDRYSDLNGYICRECFDELVSLGAETNIARFMNSPSRMGNRDASFARFNVEFPDKDDYES